MRFNKLDLNLLIAFDALIKEQSVSRAANQLNLSQSAMSGALGRLRDFFGDELFVPIGRQMVLTPLAESLQEQVQQLLLRAKLLIDTKPSFNPSKVERKVRMIASDFVIDVLLVDVIRHLRKHAAGISLDIEAPSRKGEDLLAHGDIDLMITPEFVLNREQSWRPLFTDTYVCCTWAGNAEIKDGITLDQYLTMNHVQVRFGRDRASTFDFMYLERQGLKRNEVIVAPTFTIVPYMMDGTDLITTMPSRLAALYSQRVPLKMIPIPMDIPPLVQVLQWNRLYNHDPLLMWLKDLIVEHSNAKWPLPDTPAS